MLYQALNRSSSQSNISNPNTLLTLYLNTRTHRQILGIMTRISDQNDDTHSHALQESDSTHHQMIEIQDEDNKSSTKKIKDLEICVPIAYGTISFWLGKKATETQSHTWTVYVRGATNEDLGAIIKKVVFQLHPSFSNARRVVESPPFELTERGWGEFEIAISIFFHDDVCSDKQVDLFHPLKLYSEVEHGPLSTKKPVIVESYDEIVLPNPPEKFLARVHDHPAVIVPRLPPTLNLPHAPTDDSRDDKRGDTKDHPHVQWFNKFSEADELLKLAEARQQVQNHIVKLRRRMSMLDNI